MNDMTLYWIWMQSLLGAGARIDEGVAYFENPKAVYEATRKELYYSDGFSAAQINKLQNKSLDKAEKILIECEQLGCGVITPDSPKYPQQLFCMTNYPLVLYTMGDIECLKGKLAISIVGTRKASDSGLDIAGKISASLCRAGVVVVSGGALGIDSAAHLGAVSAGGPTVAVLGCGFNAKYHDGTENIKYDIIEKGALITEFYPSAPARGMNFPIRNRIIAALSKGTVVIEAAKKSGSLITANIAMDYGRDIFAVPGNAANLTQLGTVELIRDGAIPVFSSSDILGQYEFICPDLINWDKVETDLLYQNAEKIDFSKIKYGVRSIHTPRNKNISRKEEESVPVIENDAANFRNIAKEENVPANENGSVVSENFLKEDNAPLSEHELTAPDGLSDAEKAVFQAIAQGAKDSDSIKEKTELSMSQILVALTTMEISGIIKCLPGHIYKITT